MTAPDDLATPPEHPELLNFWEIARPHTKMNQLVAYMGTTAAEAVPPPAWSYGETVQSADDFVRKVLASPEVQIVTPLSAYQDASEDVPQIGVLSILCDGSGRPRALLADSLVETHDVDGVPSVTETLSVIHSVD